MPPLRLRQIKLAGFKSFVDPMAVAVPGQLVAVVGPNGCGKSNIIDAVRWVLGEMSAKQLRGESMQDVIFNGSGNRRPLSRASVELVFDNSLGRVTGPWSVYGEIAIKRVLTRDGTSSYHINNQPVRRRDITDLFLGTGVGSRGYAVIEQGMISRIIEARPEELREFLEEAAGVSKYKERRRETEHRLADARENLLRIDDIRLELTQQIDKLRQQAEVAQRYRALQDEQGLLQSLLAYARRLEGDTRRVQLDRELDTARTELEAQSARLREIEAQLEAARDSHYQDNDAVHAAQAALFEVNAQLARLEQTLQHRRESRERHSERLSQLRRQLDQASHQAAALTHEIETADAHRFELEERQLDADTRLHEEADALPHLESTLSEHRHALDGKQHAVQDARQRLKVQEAHLGHVQRQRDQAADRLRRAEGGLAALPAVSVAQDSEDDGLQALALAAEEAQLRLEAAVEAEQSAELALQEAETAWRDTDRQESALQSERGALKTLLNAARAGDDLAHWLDGQGLSSAPAAWERIKVRNGWETALSAVLRERMQARVSRTQADWIAEPPPARVALVDQLSSASTSFPADSLRAQIDCDDPSLAAALDEWLTGIFLADAREGVSQRQQLPAGQWLVTKEGHLLSRHSVVLTGPDSSGDLLRHRDALHRVESELAALADVRSTGQSRLESARLALESARQQTREARLQADMQRDARHRAELAHQQQQQRLALDAARREQLQRELAEAQDALAQLTEEHETVALSLDGLHDALHEHEQAFATLRAQLTDVEHAAQQARQRQRDIERTAQEARFAVSTCRQRLDELTRRRGLLEEQAQSLREQLESALLEDESFDDAELQLSVQAGLETREQREKALADARARLDAATQQLRTLDETRLTAERGLEPLRERIQSLTLASQEARLTVEQFDEVLQGIDPAQLGAELAARGQKGPQLARELQRVQKELEALGAVNLAALDELKEAESRMGYLDAQGGDLNQAIETLESAIRRIDRETRALLQDTFDRVNASLTELFPLLFGGGRAELTLTGDEILDAGVHLMAQPPGKKNSTIHLLSGGEKALTALALVFSLFRLNPAPFCLLDEVDAPLDDANTGRFCEMVKKMSAETQFLYISHNKITMEMAEQLIGITMQEQGVSRVVAVDIEEAMQMAGAV